MARMIEDPPDAKRYQQRGDPPVSMWPGQFIKRERVMMAGGDPRDWFRVGHRLEAVEYATYEFVDARRRRKNFMAGFDWNQILILGDYGSGKTTLGSWLAYKWFRLGHPVFSNASTLIGWQVEHEQMYTALGFMPAASILLIDESSAALASRVGHGVAVATFGEMNLNTRKKNGIIVYMSAQDWEIASSIRRNCKEVWMPVPKGDFEVSGAASGFRGRPADNPDNFRMVWHVWDDYPYRKANLIEGKQAADTDGFGPPTYTMYAEGEEVRMAYLLTDTFELAAAGAATIADRDMIKDELAAFRDRHGPSRSGRKESREELAYKERVGELLNFFGMRANNPPSHFTAAEIGAAVGLPAMTAGQFIQELLPGIKPTGRGGYPSDEIYTRLNALLGQE